MVGLAGAASGEGGLQASIVPTELGRLTGC